MNRLARPWADIGESQTVFELAATAPATAGRLLVDSPGMLLARGPNPTAGRELGPVLVTTVGVSVGGVVLSEPAAEVRVEGNGHELIFGKHRLRPDRAIPAEFASELKAWLRFRAEVLAAYPAVYLNANPRQVSRLLKPFVTRCPACGTECAPVVGAIARSV